MKLTERNFVVVYIRVNKGKYPGVHAVYGGLNEAFRAQFNGADPIAETKRLVDSKVLVGSRKDSRYLLVVADMPALKNGKAKTNRKSKAQIGREKALAAIKSSKWLQT